MNTNLNEWSGGSRLIPDGHIHPYIALICGCTLASIVVGLQLLLPSYLPSFSPTFYPTIIALIWGWQYTAPPLKCCYRSLGEFTEAFIIAFIFPFIGTVAQLQVFDKATSVFELLDIFWRSQEAVGVRLAMIALFPLMIIRFTRMLVVNILDEKGDAAAGKVTLVVLIGVPATVYLYSFLQFATLFILLLNIFFSPVPLAISIGTLMSVPLGIIQGKRLRNGDWKEKTLMVNIAARSSLQVMLSSPLTLLGLLLFV